MNLFRQLVYRQTNRQTDGRTLLVPLSIATENRNKETAKKAKNYIHIQFFAKPSQANFITKA